MKNLPVDLSNKIQTSLQTPANNADPKMALTVVRAKDTVMDNTYWTTEVIRTKEGLGDLSIAARRLKPYGGPDSLYNIYVDNGVVKTATRAYPDYQKDGWQDQFELGPGTAVAISFDGYWERYKGKWQMVTSEEPWLFWVESGKLIGQIWSDLDSRIELVSSGVSKVKAIRAWKNVNLPEIDQGIVVAYIKTNGKVYYRNYAWQNTGFFVWENEKEVTEFVGTFVNLNLFITNDYRMGIIVENNNQEISMVITSRAWAGMAIAPENFSIIPSIQIDLHKVTYYDGFNNEHFNITPSIALQYLYGSSFNEFIMIENIENNDNYGLMVIFKVQEKIINFVPTDFELYDENSVRFRGLSGTKLDDYNFQVIFEDFNNAVGIITLKCLGLTSTNEAGYLFSEFMGTFIPYGLIPVQIDPPVPEVIWNE